MMPGTEEVTGVTSMWMAVACHFWGEVNNAPGELSPNGPLSEYLHYMGKG